MIVRNLMAKHCSRERAPPCSVDPWVRVAEYFLIAIVGVASTDRRTCPANANSSKEEARVLLESSMEMLVLVHRPLLLLLLLLRSLVRRMDYSPPHLIMTGNKV